MSNTETKTCSITEDEIKALIIGYAQRMDDDNIEDSLERMNYLNRRLKAEKKEVEPKSSINPEFKSEPKPSNQEPKASW